MEEEIEFEKISALQTKTTAIFHRLQVANQFTKLNQRLKMKIEVH